MEKKDVFSIVRYLDIKNMSVHDMQHLMDLFNIKSKQMEEEIRQRRKNGEA